MGEPQSTKRAYQVTAIIDGETKTYKTFARSREQARTNIKRVVTDHATLTTVELANDDAIPSRETDGCEIENLDTLIQQANREDSDTEIDESTDDTSEIPEHTGVAKKSRPPRERLYDELDTDRGYSEGATTETAEKPRITDSTSGRTDPYWRRPDETEPDHPEPDEVLRNNAKIYTEKNADYGEAWLLAAKTMELWGAELGVDEIPTDAESMAGMGLYWERLIKLIRAFNLEYSDQSPSNESTAESHSDASTYAAIQSSFVRGDRDE